MTARAALVAVAAVVVAVPAARPRDPVAVAASAVRSGPVADPFPIRRTFLSGDRLTAALADVARGTLVRLPREEFEAKVRAASQRAAVPRLAEARYRATLTEAGLSGSAEWRVAGTGLLALDSLRPAVFDPKWADGSPAAIIRIEQPAQTIGSYLVLDRAGDNTVSLNWSARGSEEPGAERFDLAFPPAPVAALELDLPADRVPVIASADQLLTGPIPGPAADRRLWRVAFGGRPQVDLAVRRPHRPGEPGAAVRVNRMARYDLAAGFATCAVDLELEPVRGQLTEFTLEADPGLQVTGMTGPGRFGWRIEPGDPTRIVVTGSDVSSVGRLTVTGFAAMPASGAWVCPQVRVAAGLPGTDTAEIRLDPELKFNGLEPGDYRVTAAGADEDGYRVALTGTLIPRGSKHPDRRPPTVRMQSTGAEYTSTEEVTWRVAAGRTDLTARLRVRVIRGPLVQIPVKVPAGWSVESVRLVPDDPGVPPTQQPGPDGLLRIEPTRAVSSGQAVELRVDLRGPPAPPAPDPTTVGTSRVAMPFPQVTVTGATEREGLLTLTVSPAFRAWPTPVPPHDPATDRGASLAYPFHGHPPTGQLILAPRLPRVAVSGDTTVSLEAGELTAATTFTARSTDGEFGSLTVFTPGGPGMRWEVRADGAEVRPLLGGEMLPAVSPWSAVLGAVAAVPGSMWQVRYPRATAGPVTVIASAHRPADPDAPARVPLPTVLGTTADTPQIVLTPSAAARYEQAGGSDRSWAVLRPRGVLPPLPPAAGPGWAFSGVGLVTRVESGGRLTGVFTGTVQAAAGPGLPVGLPPGAELTAALVAGHYIDQPATTEMPGAEGHWIVLPLPATGPDGTPFEVRYRLPGTTGESGLLHPVTQLVSPVPGLPTEPDAVAMKWLMTDEFQRWPALDSPSGPADGGAELVVVSAAAVSAVAYALAAIVLGIGAGLLARGRVRKRLAIVLAVGVAALGIAAQVTPEGWRELLHPTLAAGLLSIVAVILFAIRPAEAAVSEPNSKPNLPSTVSHSPLAVGLLALLAAGSAAQAPEPATVFVIPASPSDPGRLAVLASQSVLDRLDALARSPVPPVAITAATYEGSAVSADAPAQFTATYEVRVTGSEASLTLPLQQVRLEGVELDGKPAFPRTESQPDRYVVAVRGAGSHTVTARFVVPPTATGGDREVRFGVPEVACCRVRFTAPAGATQLDTTTRRGAQTSAKDGERPRIDADHGSNGKWIAVRWRDGSATTSKVAIAVREACVWDLSESDASAIAAFVYRIDGGSTHQLRIEFPDGLEPGRVTLRSGEMRPGPGLRDLQLGAAAAGWRSLTLSLQAPVEGRLTVIVKFTARRPLEDRTVLHFPRAAGVTQSESYYAVRLAGLAVVDIGHGGVIDYPAEVLAKEFATVTDLGLDRPLDRVLQKAAGAAARVELALRPVGETNGTSAEVAWTVGPLAEADGVIRSSKAATSVVEFDLPRTVRLDEVRAPDLQTWSRSGSRVQVWFKKPARDVMIRWSGALVGYPPKGAQANPLNLTLPLARPVGGGPVTVRVRAAEGWAVVAEPGKEFKPLAHNPVGEEGFTAEPTATAVPVRVFMPASPHAADVLETVEWAGDSVRYRAVVRVPVVAGRPHHFGLRLIGLPAGAETGVQGPEGVSVGRTESAADRAAWVVVAPVGAAGSLTFTLSATVPLAARLPRPAVSFGGAPLDWTGRALAADPTLTVTDGPPGWRAGDASRLHSAWPSEAARLTAARVWMTDEPVGSWAVAAAPPPERPGPAAVAGGPAAAPIAPELPVPVTPAAWVPDIRSTGAAVAWAAALALFLTLVGRGGRSLWPEGLIGCGLLGVTALGADTTLAALFWMIAALGAAGRVGWFARRVARVAMR